MTPRTGIRMIAAGVVLVVFGLIGGLAFAEDDEVESDSVAVGTTSTLPRRTTTTERPAETPQELYALLERAFAENDDELLFARLDRAVLDAYGEDGCRAYLERLTPPGPTFEVVSVGDPAPWTFGARDGLAIEIADAIPVGVVITQDGEAQPVQETHVRREGRELRWFTDCGDPL